MDKKNILQKLEISVPENKKQGFADTLKIIGIDLKDNLDEVYNITPEWVLKLPNAISQTTDEETKESFILQVRCAVMTSILLAMYAETCDYVPKVKDNIEYRTIDMDYLRALDICLSKYIEKGKVISAKGLRLLKEPFNGISPFRMTNEARKIVESATQNELYPEQCIERIYNRYMAPTEGWNYSIDKYKIYYWQREPIKVASHGGFMTSPFGILSYYLLLYDALPSKQLFEDSVSPKLNEDLEYIPFILIPSKNDLSSQIGIIPSKYTRRLPLVAIDYLPLEEAIKRLEETPVPREIIEKGLLSNKIADLKKQYSDPNQLVPVLYYLKNKKNEMLPNSKGISRGKIRSKSVHKFINEFGI